MWKLILRDNLMINIQSKYYMFSMYSDTHGKYFTEGYYPLNLTRKATQGCLIY